jgi:hypothetical protein
MGRVVWSKRGEQRGHGGAHRRGEKQWRDSGSSVGWRGHEVEERGGVMGCLGALVREDERGKKRGVAVMGRPL